MGHILVLGANSAIALACIHRWAKQGNHFFLVSRSEQKLSQTAADMTLRYGVQVSTYVADLANIDQQQAMLDHIWPLNDVIDMVMIAYGQLPDQQQCQSDPQALQETLCINAVSVLNLLTLIANRMEQAKHGHIVVLSSVSGERGRVTNYVYGAAKAAVTTFCEGLAGRMYRAGVSLTLVKPGFVATPMTAQLTFPAMLVATPEQVAKDIDRAVLAKKNVISTPWFWRPVMALLKAIPSAIWKRMRF